MGNILLSSGTIRF